jgi:hypothetical protein
MAEQSTASMTGFSDPPINGAMVSGTRAPATSLYTRQDSNDCSGGRISLPLKGPMIASVCWV